MMTDTEAMELEAEAAIAAAGRRGPWAWIEMALGMAGLGLLRAERGESAVVTSGDGDSIMVDTTLRIVRSRGGEVLLATGDAWAKRAALCGMSAWRAAGCP